MSLEVHSPAATPCEKALASRSLKANGDADHQIEIAGHVYATPERVAELLGVTTRTLARWHAARIGPPKIKIGKKIFFELGQLPDWLSSREIAPVKARRH